MSRKIPARRYQLGVLLSAEQDVDGAIAAFEQAVALDPQYANARYFLALGYVEKGEIERAVEQLQVVSDLNPENQDVRNLIAGLQDGSITASSPANTEPVDESGEGDDGQISQEDLESDLITSPNPPVSDTNPEEAESSEAPATSETAAE